MYTNGSVHVCSTYMEMRNVKLSSLVSKRGLCILYFSVFVFLYSFLFFFFVFVCCLHEKAVQFPRDESVALFCIAASTKREKLPVCCVDRGAGRTFLNKKIKSLKFESLEHEML